jgi:hypothetical protein
MHEQHPVISHVAKAACGQQKRLQESLMIRLVPGVLGASIIVLALLGGLGVLAAIFKPTRKAA